MAIIWASMHNAIIAFNEFTCQSQTHTYSCMCTDMYVSIQMCVYTV